MSKAWTPAARSRVAKVCCSPCYEIPTASYFRYPVKDDGEAAFEHNFSLNSITFALLNAQKFNGLFVISLSFLTVPTRSN